MINIAVSSSSTTPSAGSASANLCANLPPRSRGSKTRKNTQKKQISLPTSLFTANGNGRKSKGSTWERTTAERLSAVSSSGCGGRRCPDLPPPSPRLDFHEASAAAAACDDGSSCSGGTQYG